MAAAFPDIMMGVKEYRYSVLPLGTCGKPQLGISISYKVLVQRALPILISARNTIGDIALATYRRCRRHQNVHAFLYGGHPSKRPTVRVHPLRYTPTQYLRVQYSTVP